MRRLIIRADDFGYTRIHNLGTFEAIDNGIVTSVDMMLDTPGSIDAMERIKDYPWISIGWHAHFWGRPVLDPSEVPSM
ncbi:MAG: ChbG/HpnK family deacetylase, partial [Erysipelotrichaceae bacterium]